MTITITVEEELEGHKIIRASRQLLDLEIKLSNFDLPCHTIKKLREEVAREKEEYIRGQERALDV